MNITNTTRSDIGLQPGVIVPAMGSIEVDGNDFAKIKGLPSVKAHFDNGRLAHTGGTVSKAAPAQDASNGPDRTAIIAGIIRGLPDTEYTKGGKPEVDAINAVAKWEKPVTAAERDAVWEGMSA